MEEHRSGESPVVASLVIIIKVTMLCCSKETDSAFQVPSNLCLESFVHRPIFTDIHLLYFCWMADFSSDLVSTVSEFWCRGDLFLRHPSALQDAFWQAAPKRSPYKSVSREHN